ncbi:unnamed protein product [Psylliodes chrysocephalus]|uniref:DUF4371 domain-containing protein n=1 Tax=Psylliodes chrysocephalus TaxID=3402493 RepID=A0A9P0GBW2_9CUCU|nr:unnamed protein product [Psylliodes chrysocephala]
MKHKERNMYQIGQKTTNINKAFIAEHNLLYRVAEHLPSLISKICTDSEIAKNIQCGRTKTTAIVKNVIGQSGSNTIYAILRSSKFSVIIDESTDISTKKHLVIVARYFYENKIHDTFLTLIEMKSSRTADIYKEIVNFNGFRFYKTLLPLFNNLNKEMQSSEPKLYILHSRLCNLYKTILDYFVKKIF